MCGKWHPLGIKLMNGCIKTTKPGMYIATSCKPEVTLCKVQQANYSCIYTCKTKVLYSAQYIITTKNGRPTTNKLYDACFINHVKYIFRSHAQLPKCITGQ